MTKQQFLSKILGLIDAIDAVISDRGKQSAKAAKLQEGKETLQGLLDDLQEPGQPVDPERVLLIFYKTAELIWSWISEEQ